MNLYEVHISRKKFRKTIVNTTIEYVFASNREIIENKFFPYYRILIKKIIIESEIIKLA